MAALPPDMRKRYAALGEHVSNWLGYTDPPKHTRLRGLLRPEFTPALAESYRPKMSEIVNELIAVMLQEQRPDLVSGYAFQLSARVICNVLGILEERSGDFHRWSNDMAAFTGHVGPTLVEIAPRAYDSYLGLEKFVEEQVVERQRCPHHDLIEKLAVAEREGVLQSRPELTGLTVFTLVAGHETTASLIGNALKMILEDDRLRAELAGNAGRIPAAVDEFLRLETPVQFAPRLAVEDIPLAYATIRKGDAVMLHLAAANRDPERFPDPDRLDLDRSFTRHFAFGWGAHFCLGAPLARMETEIAIESLFKLMPDVRLTGEPLRWRGNMSMRALVALPVNYGKG